MDVPLNVIDAVAPVLSKGTHAFGLQRAAS